MCLFLGTLLLSRLRQRAYYEDGQYLVNVRYGQWHDLRDFIQPSNPDVLAEYSQIGPNYWALYDFVCRNISYRLDFGEFWQVPSETLRGYGDCEDSSILLTSLLRNFTNAHVAVGEYQGYGHAWCQGAGQILETTYTFAQPVPDPQDYRSYLYFDDREVIELWPGALEEIFALRRDEVTKLDLMAAALSFKKRSPQGLTTN
ncbi:hypothetical protein ES703_16679 [subsurface metagenome]